MEISRRTFANVKMKQKQLKGLLKESSTLLLDVFGQCCVYISIEHFRLLHVMSKTDAED